MSTHDFSWAVPVMRAGYAGRGLTYVAVAGISLWSIWRGGQAQGTGSVLKILGSSGWGNVVLALIAAGLLAYTVWRIVDAIWDLEAYGTEAKGIVARLGMFVTGAIHGALGVLAVLLVLGQRSGGGGEGSGGGDGIASYVGQVLAWDYGRWIVGIAGALTIGAGIYYLVKGVREEYREKLIGNEVTANWNWVLKAGLLAQGVIVGLIGFFLVRAGLNGDSDEAGGLNKVFEFLSAQTFGQIVVVVMCLGLLAFAVFCFVNARYRIVERASEEDFPTLGAVLRQ